MKKRFTQAAGWLIATVLLVGSTLVLSSDSAAQQRSRNKTQLLTAYTRGYTAGYADGYNGGKDVYLSRAERDCWSTTLYQEASQGYEPRFGAQADYQEGYRLGFEIGYLDGYSGRVYSTSLPPNVVQLAREQSQRERRQPDQSYPLTQAPIPLETSLRIRLETRLTTKENQAGDPFEARVVEPNQYEGALIRGHLAKVDRSGRMTGRTEIALDFDTITLRDGRSSPLHAQIEKVFATESVKAVDEEGNVESASKTKETEIRAFGGAVLGTIIGGITKGGKGAAIGAAIGAGVGAGSVYVQGRKDLILEPGTQMMVRTTGPQRERAAQ